MSTGSLHDLLFFCLRTEKKSFSSVGFSGVVLCVCTHCHYLCHTQTQLGLPEVFDRASLLHSLVQVCNQLCPTAQWLITSWQHVILLCLCGAQSLKCRSGASPWIFEYFSFSFTFQTYLDQKMETVLKVEICSFLNNKVELFFFKKKKNSFLIMS